MPLSYETALSRLTTSTAVRPGLERSRRLLEALGRPQEGLRGVLVAGTNGKGSVCAIVDSICRAAGHSSALLTNPHLVSYRERIVLDGVPLDRAAFARLAEDVLDAAAGMDGGDGFPTQFELLTAMGILAAARAGSEVVVCEVGLGGRLDSTNVVDLGVAAITDVSLEHEALLGDTVEKIAAEKAGIVKAGNDVATSARGEALRVIERRAEERGARLRVIGRDLPVRGVSLGWRGVEVEAGDHLVRVPLAGDHQIANAALALLVADLLSNRGLALDERAVRAGCASVTWRGRMELRPGRPETLLDGAHNPAGMRALVAAASGLCAGRRVVALVAIMRDKRAAEMLSLLRPLTPTAVFTAVDDPRSLPVEELAAAWEGTAHGESSSMDALERARRLAGEEGVVVVCGSLYLVGEVIAALEPGGATPPP